ncbi:MAG: cytochrome c oxidase subunit 3, partial [Bradyrhizobium sp.]
MADAHAKPHHDYHLVNPSPWPLIGSGFAFLTAVGLIISMHAKDMALGRFGPVMLGIGIAGILYVMASWWMDVVHEAETGDHTRVVQISHRYGMILFIASEVMFFVAWFWAYFDAALFPADHVEYMRTEVLGGHWPPVPTADDRFKSTFDPW